MQRISPESSRISNSEIFLRDSRAFSVHWLILLAAQLVLAAFLLFSLHQDRNKLLATAEDRLNLAAQGITDDLDRRLVSINQALLDLESNLPQTNPAFIGRHLESIANAIDGVRTLIIYDGNGTVTASSRPELIGLNFRHRPYFQTALQNNDSTMLFVPAPFETSLGTLSLNLYRTRNDASGRFLGIISATLAPEDFKPILASYRYAADVSIGLIHPSGKTLFYVSMPEIPPLTDVSDPRSFFSRHMQSGNSKSLLEGFDQVLPNERMASVQTIFSKGLVIENPLVVVVSQEFDSILEPWKQAFRIECNLLLLVAVLSTTGLWIYQRQQKRHAVLLTQHQRELLAQTDRLQLASRISGTGIWERDLETQALIWDDTMFSLYGRERSTFSPTQETWKECVLPEDLPLVEAKLRKSIENREPFESVFRIRQGNGEIRTLQVMAGHHEKIDGTGIRLIGVNIDITEQLRTEKVLHDSRENIVSILDSLVPHIAVLDATGNIVMVNESWRTFARNNGGSADCIDPLGLSYLGVCRQSCNGQEAEFSIEALNGIQKVLSGHSDEFTLEYPCHSPDQQRWFVMHVTPLRGTLWGVVVAHEDITVRHLAEESIRNAHNLTQQFLDHLPGTAFIKDENLRVVMASTGFKNILGIDPATMIGKSNTELFPDGLGEKIDADDLAILESGKTTIIEEDFAGRHFESTKFLLNSGEGHRFLGGITADVTERHKHFERQRTLLKISEIGGALEEKEFLQQGLEMAEKLTGSQMAFLHFVNPDQETIELVTWTKQTLKGCTATHASHYPLSQAGIWADCAREKRQVVFNDYPGYAAKKGLPQGHVALQRLISVPVVEEGQVHMILGVGNKPHDYDDQDSTTLQLIGNDLWRITHRIRVENQLKNKLEELTVLNNRLDKTNNMLLQSEKLAAIGQLAAGVAHEINNPVGFVSSNLTTLGEYVNDFLAITAAYEEIEKLASSKFHQAFEKVNELKANADFSFIVSDVRNLLGESREGLERVRKIVQDLKEFSRVGNTGWQQADIHQGLESTLNIVWNEIKYKAEVIREYGNLPEICCIPSQLNQVFLNLLTNAAQAIENHGQIVLRSGRKGEEVWIEVSDDGKGIAPENMNSIFDPFFTTKPVGKGTGLGLSLSWGIINRHHGRIEVDSAPGKGTTFRVILPIEQPDDTTHNDGIPS